MGETDGLIGEILIMKTNNIDCPNLSALARKYGVDRHTVKKYWDAGRLPERKKRDDYSSKYDAYLEESREIMSRPGVSVMACWTLLKDRHPGFPGTYNGFRSYLRSKEVTPGKAKAHPRYETDPGDQLQVDWKEDMRLEARDGSVIQFNVFSATLGYSRMHLFAVSEGKGTQDFIRCLVDVLARIGGVPRRILTDNMSAVVSCRGGGRRKLNEIVQLERDLGCEIRLCRPRTPETKGKVESSNRFVNRLAAYSGQVSCLADVGKALAFIEREANAQVCQTTGIPPIVLFDKEKAKLRPVPSCVLEQGYGKPIVTRVVSPQGTVRHRGCDYSCPASLIGKRVEVGEIGGMVAIMRNGEVVVSHKPSESRFSYVDEHYLGLFAGSGDDERIRAQALENLKRLSEVGRK